MNSLERHVAGATVSHISPFAELQVPISDQMLPLAVRETWVRPLYFGLRKPDVGAFVAGHIHLVSDELISQLLENFDWRPRTVAAYLAALTGRSAFTSQIGRLLLRSDVCFAGSAYCVALAEFNSAESIDFLNRYLSYYLTRYDLWFDQGDAMGALSYLDRLNGTDLLSGHLDAWSKFIANKDSWTLASCVVRFDETMTILHELKAIGC
jgi:hypothetical protein